MRFSLIWCVALAVFSAIGCGSRTVGTSSDGGEFDGNENSSGSCVDGSCLGCCTPEGICLLGTSNDACGTGGEECADCAVLTGTCVEGRCEGTAACGTDNCPGCCDSGGQCLSGTTEDACGTGGSACSVCDGDCSEGQCCLDQDGDGFGEGCSLGPDCDDSAPGIIDDCDQNGCPQGWAFVPAGGFIAGCLDDYDYPCGAHAFDEANMQLEAFCIESTETDVEMYRSCQAAGVCSDPAANYPLGGGCNWSEDGLSDRLDHPINCVEWPRAQDFCQRWFGGDLPTEWQWEKAARGTDGRYFPWGNSPLPNDCSLCNYYHQDCLADEDLFTWPAGYLSSGAGDSPYGVKDMCGNLLEFTRSCLFDTGEVCDLGTEGESIVTRGGESGFPWSDLNEFSATKLTTYFRGAATPSSGDASWQIWGFRCARAPWAGIQSPGQP